jgi:hypothetical protein
VGGGAVGATGVFEGGGAGGGDVGGDGVGDDVAVAVFTGRAVGLGDWLGVNEAVIVGRAVAVTVAAAVWLAAAVAVGWMGVAVSIGDNGRGVLAEVGSRDGSKVTVGLGTVVIGGGGSDRPVFVALGSTLGVAAKSGSSRSVPGVICKPVASRVASAMILGSTRANSRSVLSPLR